MTIKPIEIKTEIIFWLEPVECVFGMNLSSFSIPCPIDFCMWWQRNISILFDTGNLKLVVLSIQHDVDMKFLTKIKGVWLYGDSMESPYDYLVTILPHLWVFQFHTLMHNRA